MDDKLRPSFKNKGRQTVTWSKISSKKMNLQEKSDRMTLLQLKALRRPSSTLHILCFEFYQRLPVLF